MDKTMWDQAKKRYVGTMALAIVVLAVVASPQPNAQESDCAGPVYEIAKATADRIWRLNKCTGEIQMCRLEGDRLVCSSSMESASPPPTTYEQMEAEKEQEAAEAHEMKKAEQQRALQILDRILAAIRDIVSSSMTEEPTK